VGTVGEEGLGDLRGVKHLFYLQVDNPLVEICSPEFLGYHLLSGSEMSTEVVAKRTPLDRVGNVVEVEGRLQVVEYSDLPKRVAERRNADGSLLLSAGSIAVHAINVAFLERMAARADALPFHFARKKVQCIKPGSARPLAEKVDPRLFIEEMGKTGFAELQEPAPRDVIAKMSAGDPVYLTQSGRLLEAKNARGEYLGRIEPRLSLRLLNFIKHGNQYAAGITSLDDSNVRIIIKEVHQDPSMAGRVSFPPRGPEGIRPYIKDSLLRYELEDEEGGEEGEYGGAEWEAEHEQLGEEPELYEDDEHPREKHEEFEI